MNTWLVENTKQIGTLESAVRTLTLFAPGQLNQIEVLSEASGAAIQGLSVWHDIAVAQFLRQKRPDLVTSHAKYTQKANENPVYLAASAGYTALRASELLIEMVARQRKGEKGRWEAVLGVETAKVVLRLAALSSTARPLPHSLVYERTVDPEQIEALLVTQEPSGWHMPRTNKALPLNTPAREVLASKVLVADDVLEPLKLIKPLDKLSTYAEVLGILRPLLYALAAFRFRRQATWKPWVFGIVIEFLARQLTQKSLALRGYRHASSLEKQRLQAKTASLKWWALRGEFYSSYTRPVIAGIASKLDNLPVLSIVGMLMTDSLYLWDTFYFASASA